MVTNLIAYASSIQNSVILMSVLCLFNTTPISAQTFNLNDSLLVKNETYTTWDIIFEFDSDHLVPESLDNLNRISEFIQAHEEATFEIGVHCDERHSELYSTCLTCTRAAAIKEYLIDLGIDKNQLLAKGYNDDYPLLVEAKTEEEHRKNRRVEIKVLFIKD